MFESDEAGVITSSEKRLKKQMKIIAKSLGNQFFFIEKIIPLRS